MNNINNKLHLFPKPILEIESDNIERYLKLDSDYNSIMKRLERSLGYCNNPKINQFIADILSNLTKVVKDIIAVDGSAYLLEKNVMDFEFMMVNYEIEEFKSLLLKEVLIMGLCDFDNKEMKIIGNLNELLEQHCTTHNIPRKHSFERVLLHELYHLASTAYLNNDTLHSGFSHIDPADGFNYLDSFNEAATDYFATKKITDPHNKADGYPIESTLTHILYLTDYNALKQAYFFANHKLLINHFKNYFETSDIYQMLQMTESNVRNTSEDMKKLLNIYQKQEDAYFFNVVTYMLESNFLKNEQQLTLKRK